MMKKEEKPIFKNDLSPEEQKKQDKAFEEDRENKEKLQKKLAVVDAAAEILSIITGH